MNNWKFLTGDMNWEDYGGKFYLRVGETRFLIIDVLNWYDAVGEEEAPANYNVSLDECNIAVLTSEHKKILTESCGWDDMEDTPLVWAELMHGYGMKAPLWDASGDDIDSLMSEAKMEAGALIENPEEHKALMDRPVNQIGSTAREFMVGDLDSAMDRALAHETVMEMMGPEMSMAGPGMKPTFTMKVDMGFVQRHGISDDPLAYTFGYMHGHTGTEMDRSRGELAEEYIKGHALGTKVGAGEEPRPAWHR